MAMSDSDSEHDQFDLFEAAVCYKRDKEYPQGTSVNQKRVIRKKAAKLILQEGEVFVKKGEQVSNHS